MVWFGLSRLLIKLTKNREAIRSFLEVDDWEDNRAAAERLTQLGDVDGLILGLQNAPHGISRIIDGLHKLGDPSAVRPLCAVIKGMGDREGSARLAAIYAVAALAAPGDSTSVETLGWVVMQGDDRRLQETALEAAERIDPGSVPGALAANFTLEALRRLTVEGDHGLDPARIRLLHVRRNDLDLDEEYEEAQLGLSAAYDGLDVLAIHREWNGRVLGHIRQEVSPADVVISADLSGLAAKRSNVITWTLTNRGDGPAVGISVLLSSPDMPLNEEDDFLFLFEDVDLYALGDKRQFDMAFTPKTAGDIRWNLDIDYWM